jgi:hypothetical protein
MEDKFITTDLKTPIYLIADLLFKFFLAFSGQLRSSFNYKAGDAKSTKKY